MAKVAPLLSKMIPGTRSSVAADELASAEPTVAMQSRRAMVRCRGCRNTWRKGIPAKRPATSVRLRPENHHAGILPRQNRSNNRRVRVRKRARAGSATMGARVPSKSKASSTRPWARRRRARRFCGASKDLISPGRAGGNPRPLLLRLNRFPLRRRRAASSTCGQPSGRR